MSFWANRTVFVTGATGFVGSHLVRHLVAQGARLVCLQRNANSLNRLDLFDLQPHVKLIEGSVEDLPLIEKTLNEYKIDTVFHLAAQAFIRVANRSPLSTFESNIRGTYCLLEACRGSASVKRIVVASSDKAYGTHERLPYREDFELRGLFPHDASKVCADLLARSFANTYDMPVAVTRFANIYGPGDLNLSRLVPATIISVLRGEAPIILSDGTPLRDFVYTDDVARGYLLLAENIEENAGEAFNFGSGEPIQVLDLVQRIIKLAGKADELAPQVILKTKIEHEIDATYLSAEKAATRLGWRPEVNLDEGLQKTIKWYRSNLNQLRLMAAAK